MKIKQLTDLAAKADYGTQGDLTEARTRLVQLGSDILDVAKTEARELDDDEQAALESGAKAIDTLDVKLKAAERSAHVKSMFSRGTVNVDTGEVTGGPGLGGPTDSPEGARLNFRAKAATVNIAAKMADPTGQKAIASSGDAITGVPLDGTIYEQGRVHNTALAILPFRKRVPQYSYLRQTLRDNQAAPVAVGELKPESKYGVTSIDGKLEVIAHVSEPTPEYWLTDNTALQGFVQGEMQYGLERAVEEQVIAGDGTGINMTGVLNASGVVVQPFLIDPTTTVRRGITKLELIGYEAGGIILHPLAWEALELSRRADGTPDLGSGIPVDRAAQRLWGLRIAVSNSVPEGTGILFDLSALAVVGDGQIRTQWSSGVADDFSRNQVRARVEGRFGLDVYKPNGIVKLDLDAAA
ncbi:phage major capsid protein [Rhodococcus sp. IEGM 1401]|uniref:phage major capsid protein n=1 Tax=unclassified Rhodococcus (in: high G+C Gram-positive bacteria) TaxID=192944 RepID=UPI0022B593C7|nr:MULTISPECIES: phage major capsid protein [unclassified Rhodococcus (in: high G+C Gram-positive bacteria)]MCZ4559894.1 phage major capsid protein [Rhodococcus sp. IEGM 1401]MDI9920062.1 phage major capsid protein [Rhodococcus sp. IEGM 1372]MDV8032475.1 phage major capsid protein [Rhodococcus sp. IEGM 1414]